MITKEEIKKELDLLKEGRSEESVIDSILKKSKENDFYKPDIDWDKELVCTAQLVLQGLIVGRVGANQTMVQSQLASAAIDQAEILIRNLKNKIDGK